MSKSKNNKGKNSLKNIFLSQEELRSVDYLNFQESKNKNEQKIINKDIETLLLKQKNLGLQIELLRNKTDIKKQELRNIQLQKGNWKQDIMKKYKMKKDTEFGFNPDTGEIIIEQESEK